MYDVKIDINPLDPTSWKTLKKRCAGQVGPLVELLQGKLSKGVMELVTDQQQGLFPRPKEIKLRCSCPDGVGMCKHLAAVMYGVGNRLDSSPELLFSLRGVDHTELIEQAVPTIGSKSRSTAPTIAADELGAIFDIEMDGEPEKRSRSANTKKLAANKKPNANRKLTTVKPAKKPARNLRSKKATI